MTRTPRALMLLPLAGLVAGLLLTPASAAAPEELRLKDLTKGVRPGVPYIADGVLVDGATKIALPKSVSRLMGKVGADYLLQGYSQRKDAEVVVRVALDGARTTVVQGGSLYDATLSPDGTSFVAANGEHNRRTTLRRYDAGTGAVTAKAQLKGYGTVLGWDGTRAVVGVNNPNKTVSWNPTTGRVSTIARVWSYEADVANDLLAWLTKDPYQGGCTVVSRLSDPDTELWRSCDDVVLAFSTDGSHIATTFILSDGLGPGRFALRKTNGRKLGEFDAPYYFGGIWFEDGRRRARPDLCEDQGRHRALRRLRL